jgi:hypothetical protein
MQLYIGDKASRKVTPNRESAAAAEEERLVAGNPQTPAMLLQDFLAIFAQTLAGVSE